MDQPRHKKSRPESSQHDQKLCPIWSGLSDFSYQCTRVKKYKEVTSGGKQPDHGKIKPDRICSLLV